MNKYFNNCQCQNKCNNTTNCYGLDYEEDTNIQSCYNYCINGFNSNFNPYLPQCKYECECCCNAKYKPYK
ncbi:MAG: hypothetical protein ACRCXT_20975 [Paraclostridium sp.]